MTQTTRELLRLAVGNAKQEGTSTEELLEELILAIKGAKSGEKVEFIEISKPEENSDDDITKRITKVIQELGMPVHIKGFKYVRYAIEYSIENPKALEAMLNVLYPEIAQKFQTTPSRVERAIRHAVEIVWNRGNFDKINKYLGSGFTDKPTNSEFIATLVDYFILNK